MCLQKIFVAQISKMESKESCVFSIDVKLTETKMKVKLYAKILVFNIYTNRISFSSRKCSQIPQSVVPLSGNDETHSNYQNPITHEKLQSSPEKKQNPLV